MTAEVYINGSRLGTATELKLSRAALDPTTPVPYLPRIKGELNLELSDYGREIFTKMTYPRKAVMTVSKDLMEIMRGKPSGSTISMAGSVWRIYRRSYRFNKLYLVEDRDGRK